MNQLELARPPRSTDATVDAQHQFEEPPPVRRGALRRLADWVDQEDGTVGTDGAVARAAVATLLCLLLTLALVGALTGVAVALR
jgi:hypothetical protein